MVIGRVAGFGEFCVDCEQVNCKLYRQKDMPAT